MDSSKMDLEQIERMKGTTPLDPPLADQWRLLKKRDWLARASYHLPRADEPGFNRAVYYGLRSTNAYVHMLRLPIGQASPRHDFGAEHTIVPVRGQVDFICDQGRFSLDPLDELFIPAGQMYEYVNVGMEDAWMVDIVTRSQDWPTSGRYDD